MSKNIVVFADGTGQEGGEGNNTNVYKMFNMIEDRTPKQVGFYDPGLGTDWQKVTGNIGGMGISRNIQQCYKFIFDYYESGDKIFLFGFSRGAATVRSLSSFIHHFGILPKSRPKLIKKAYAIYEISDPELRRKRAEDFVRRHHNHWTKIEFLGCFDTVAALGLPFKGASVILDGIPGFRSSFQDFSLKESVANAYHALAIDDERLTFHPVLWDSALNSSQKMRQVWFCGMHTDVGGGYAEQTLSDIPLVWMVGKAVEHGLLIYGRHKVQIVEDADGLMHNSRGNWLTKLYRAKVRSWDAAKFGKLVVHESVLERIKIRSGQNPAYEPWIKTEDFEVEPWVRYEDQSWS